MKISLHDKLKNLIKDINDSMPSDRSKKDTAMLERGFDLIKSYRGSSSITREDVAMLNNIIVEVMGLPSSNSVGDILKGLGGNK